MGKHIYIYTLPATNSKQVCPWKKWAQIAPKGKNFVFQPSIFRCELLVSGRWVYIDSWFGKGGGNQVEPGRPEIIFGKRCSKTFWTPVFSAFMIHFKVWICVYVYIYIQIVVFIYIRIELTAYMYVNIYIYIFIYLHIYIYRERERERVVFCSGLWVNSSKF